MLDKKIREEMEQAFMDIQQPRTPYVLNNMVVGSRFTSEQQYAQCVLELSIAYDNLRIAKCKAGIKELEIKELDGGSEKDQLEQAIKQVELEQLNRARVGAIREFEFLFELRKSAPNKYSREDLDKAQPLEYIRRLETQAKQDLFANGTISVSNLEGLRQVGINPIQLKQQYLEEIKSTQRIGQDKIEKNYLSEGKVRVLLVVPTEKQAIDGLPCLKGIEMPTNVELKVFNARGKPVADNYNEAIEMCIEEGCTHLLTIEDDQVLDTDTIIRLFKFALQNPDCCVGARYPKRQQTREGVHIVVDGAHRQFLDDDGGIHEVKTLAMGCSIYPTYILKQLEYPYCKTTTNLSQDSYLTQKIRDLGYKCLVDTNIKIGHKDRDGTIYR